MAEMFGVSASPFETQHSDEVSQMQRLLTNYVRALWQTSQSTTIPDNIRAEESASRLTLQLVGIGFPQLSSGFEAKKYNKAQLEELFRRYLSAHYSKSLILIRSLARCRC